MAASFTPLLDIDTAAERLSVDVRFMRRLVAERRIQHYKVGKFLRFDPADLDAFVLAGRREAISA
jgi:excisionase family DNA binding protein